PMRREGSSARACSPPSPPGSSPPAPPPRAVTEPCRGTASRTGCSSRSGAPTGPSVSNGQETTCWIQRVGRFIYIANAGSYTVSSYRVGGDGKLILIAPVAVNTRGGSIDMTTSRGFLYVQNAAVGNVQGYEVDDDGAAGGPPGAGTGGRLPGAISCWG